MSKQYLLLCFLLSSVYSSFSQALTIDWDHFFQGDFNTLDIGAGLAIDHHNNIYTAVSWADQQAYILKYNEEGTLEWETSYTNEIYVETRKIRVDASGNVYVAGIEEDISGTFNIILLKIAPTGSLLWSRTFGNLMEHEELNDMTIDTDNNIILVGEGTFEGDLFPTAVTIKYDTNGNLLWTDYRVITNTVTEAFFVATNANNDVLTLWSSSGISHLTKLDAVGAHQWTINLSLFNLAQTAEKTILINDNNEIYVLGNRFFPTSFTDIVIHKYDTDGNLLWNDTFNSGTGIHDNIQTCGLDPTGDIIILGDAGLEYTVLKYNEAGEQIWSYISSVETNPSPENLSIDTEGDIYVCVSDGVEGTIKKHQNSNGSVLLGYTYLNTAYSHTDIEHLAVDSANKLIASGLMTKTAGSDVHNAVVKFAEDDDVDGDGFVSSEDCDDHNAAIHPDAEEIPYNGVDDDCNPNTLDDDLDEDGFVLSEDCDDTDPTIYPGAEEVPNNGIDEDCDEMDLTNTINKGAVSNLYIYPNPAIEQLNITISGVSFARLSIYDIRGRLVRFFENKQSMNVADLSAGIYIVELRDEDYKMIVRQRVVVVGGAY